jgi:hypothetical protein
MSDRATPNSITSDLLNDTGFELLEHALFEAKRVVVGQDVMIERLFLCWLARGHCSAGGATTPSGSPTSTCSNPLHRGDRAGDGTSPPARSRWH